MVRCLGWAALAALARLVPARDGGGRAWRLSYSVYAHPMPGSCVEVDERGEL